MLRQISARLPLPTGSQLVFGTREQDLDVGEMSESPGVIGMQVRHHQPAYIGGLDAQGAELRADLFFWADPLTQPEAEVGMPPGKISRFCHVRGLAGVNHDHTFRVFDHPDVDGQWFGPMGIKQRVEATLEAMPNAMNLSLFDRDGSRLNHMNTHRSSPFW